MLIKDQTDQLYCDCVNDIEQISLGLPDSTEQPRSKGKRSLRVFVNIIFQALSSRSSWLETRLGELGWIILHENESKQKLEAKRPDKYVSSQESPELVEQQLVLDV